jgi:hypothetical protein
MPVMGQAVILISDHVIKTTGDPRYLQPCDSGGLIVDKGAQRIRFPISYAESTGAMY